MARHTAEIEALEALLEGRLDAADAPRPVARLATLATTVREHTDVEAPSAAFRARLRDELLEVAAAGRPTLWTRTKDRVEAATAGVRHSMRTAAAAGLASTLIGTAGVAAAAQSALPGDVLYSVKSFTEDARMALATGDVERGRLHLALARERLEEVETGRDRLSPDVLTTTLERLDVEAAAGADELLQAVATEDGAPELLGELDDFTAELRDRLIRVTPDLPLSVRPAAERALEVLRRIDLQVAGLQGAASCEACGALTDGLPRVVLPGDGPAAPSCGCLAPVPLGSDGAPVPSAPAPSPQPQPEPGAPAPPPVEGAEPDTAPTSGGDLVGDLGSDVDDVVDDVVEPLDDVGTIVDDLLDPSSTSSEGVGDPVGEVTSEVGDVVDEVGGTVEDTASEVGSAVDDATEPLDDATDPLDGLLD